MLNLALFAPERLFCMPAVSFLSNNDWIVLLKVFIVSLQRLQLCSRSGVLHSSFVLENLTAICD